LAPAGAARALPGGSDGAWVAGHHDGVERADIDAQLERVGGHYATDVGFPQLALDLAALARKVSATIAAHGIRAGGQARGGILQIRDQDLGGQAVVGEDESLQAIFEELQGDALRFLQVAAADAKRAVHVGRVVEDEILLARGRAIARDQLERLASQRFCQLARIGDGGGGANELRLRPVEFADAL